MARIVDRRRCCWRCCRSCVQSNTVINALVTSLIIGLAAQGWNLLGRLWRPVLVRPRRLLRHRRLRQCRSCRPATASTPMRRCWRRPRSAPRSAPSSAISASAPGLRGSYFALITLAFAEVFRIIANAAPITGGAAGTLIKLQVSAANFQFAEPRGLFLDHPRAGRRRHAADARHRARAASAPISSRCARTRMPPRALGVDTLHVKLKAITLSAGITALAGAFYVQYFLFVDASIAFGTWISVEALLAPIIGGLGTVFGPLLGALALHFLGEFAKADRRPHPGHRSRAVRHPAGADRRLRARWPAGPADQAVAGAGARGGRHERAAARRRARPASASAVCWPSTTPA